MKINIAQAGRRAGAIGLSVVTYVGYGLLSASLTLPGQAAASQTVATFSTNILQSTCTINFFDDNNAPITGTFSLGTIDSSKIDNIYPNGKLFTIKLSGCGVASTKTTPQVTLTGLNADSSEVGPKDPIGYKFRNHGTAGGNSKMYFVVVGEGPSLTYAAPNTKNGIYSTVNGVFKGTAGSNGDGLTVPLYASVACHDVCSYAKGARAGTLNASLTFDFAYK